MSEPTGAEPELSGREIPWLKVVQFHKDIVARAEEGFFSVPPYEVESERWTSLSDFDARDLAGPWTLAPTQIRSRLFRLAVDQGQHESIFLGGPSYLDSSKDSSGNWQSHWRPLMYREIQIRESEAGLEVVPKQGAWCLTPLVFTLLDRLEVQLGSSLDDLAAEFIERAAVLRQTLGSTAAESVFSALFERIPQTRDRLSKKPPTNAPTPWILFAPPNQYSAVTRHLMGDYDRLESRLQADASAVGGLRLLEDRPTPSPSEDGKILPMVPLNERQAQAVRRVLGGWPLTVISGPPGTGKSQVVVSLLLNAWARGLTVLFASNNNKAVDVVRERVERFESEFPIAARAGNRNKQNIQDVLRRTLQLASNPPAVDGMSPAARYQQLQKARIDAQGHLESRIPQRIDEAWKAACKADSEYRTTMASIAEEQARLQQERASLGVGAATPDEIRRSVEETAAWLGRKDQVEALIQQDQQQLQRLDVQRTALETRRNELCQALGLSEMQAGDWLWLLRPPTEDLLREWSSRVEQALSGPVDQVLEPLEWKPEYERWGSSDEARNWARDARVLMDDVRGSCAQFLPAVQELERLRQREADLHEQLRQTEVPESVDLPREPLGAWLALYKEYFTLETGRWDFLPWSPRAQLRREMKIRERSLRQGLPLAVWARVGALDDQGRGRLGPILETIAQWLELRCEQERFRTKVQQMEERFRDLRGRAAVLRLRSIPSDYHEDGWLPALQEAEAAAGLAEEADRAWTRRVEREALARNLQVLAKEWGRLASGTPLKEAWRRGPGKIFEDAVLGLVEAQEIATITALRLVLNSGRLSALCEGWKQARALQNDVRSLQVDIERIPRETDRLRQWWAERPKSALVQDHPSRTSWPDLEVARIRIEEVGAWYERWDDFDSKRRPPAESKAHDERIRSTRLLEQAIAAIPDPSHQARAQRGLDSILSHPEADWPTDDLEQVFDEYSPVRLKARLEQLDAQLERLSFDEAKSRWLDRIQDRDLLRAVNQLERALQKSRGQVPETEHATFRSVLRAVPIWITTAQAPQAIPLEPDLFDLVVIDEASQCTLTNLLPLLYRGKSLVVIGDDMQLPAIPTIQSTEEAVLARKHGVEGHLELLGHAENNLYRSAAESLPRRRADVVLLQEHFRSHPLIIGFSNRHVYLQRLELRKDPGMVKDLPLASGLHSCHVSGVAEHGPNKRSWVNRPEAERVIKFVEEVRSDAHRGCSLGIVTPFAAQRDLLRDVISRLGLATDVLVDTANGFQGDERDIIIFSPVVAKGIASGTARWVEEPPNLINVALTRARDALIIVADLDYCRQQEGLLGKLAAYCRDVEKLRETSDEELILFSWMMMYGWTPTIHPVIGAIEVDFVLRARSGDQIAIEVDGSQHLAQQQQDRARDAFLRSQGYKVLRFEAREVRETPQDVIHRIEQHLQEV